MDKFTVRMILEILGRPPEHIKNALTQLVTKLGSEKGVKLLEKTISEPIPVQDSKDLFTSFAEVNVECESLEVFLGLIFSYMPSNVELISPEQIPFTNTDINLLANKLTLRLHDYDSIAKRMMQDREFLIKKLQEHAPQLFKNNKTPDAIEIKPEAKEGKKSKEKKPNKSKKRSK